MCVGFRVSTQPTRSWSALQDRLCVRGDDAFDEIEREGLVEGKLDGAFGSFVGGEFFSKVFDRGGGGVEADVVFIGGEVGEVFAFELEGGHLVGECLDSTRSGFADGSAQGIEDGLHLDRKSCDVGIDSYCFFVFHFIFFRNYVFMIL
jgi:hypothetical protein